MKALQISFHHGVVCLCLCLLSTTFHKVFAQGNATEPVSPFADKPCDSYSAYRDETGKPAVLLWGKAPFTDFGSRPVTMDMQGVRILRQAPPPGVHPRICFGPDDLPEMRRRLKETRCGQEAWKNILSWTECMKGRYDDTADYAKPDRYQGSFGIHGRVPLFRLSAPKATKGNGYVKSEPAAALWKSLIDGSASDFPEYYWSVISLEAFRCLIENDEKGGKECAKALMTMMKLAQAKREIQRAEQQAKKPNEPLPPPASPVGGLHIAFAYDFLFNMMTSEQRAAVHDEQAATTWSHDNYGTFNTAENSRSNWATFSYWLYGVLAIEGEPGFNELKVRGMYRGWRNLLTYGWFSSGATFEGEAKNQLGMDGVILFALRAKQYGFENLAGHPYLQAYARKFLPHSANAMLTGFHKYDLLGGSRSSSGGFASTDSIGLKFMFPEDKVIDWYYRQAVGEDYAGVCERPDGYYNGLLFFAIYASDFMPDNKDPKALNLGNTFFCGERALMMTRSSWDPTAMQLNMHVRQDNGGHPFADRNAIMVAGAGRIWSPNGYSNFRTQENSVVCIDDQSQSELVPGRLVDFDDQPLATFAIGDAKYCWDWTWHRLRKNTGFYTVKDLQTNAVPWPPGTEPELHTANDFAYTKLPYAYLDRPMTEYADWILPSGALSPYAREPRFPVVKAFRTAGLVRGSQPYAVVVDDIRKDNQPHRYDWTLPLEYDIQIAKVEHRPDGVCDILLTGADPDQKGKHPKEPLAATLDAGAVIPNGRPMLLVRMLAGADKAEPTIVELPNGTNDKKYSPIRRLVLSTTSIEPGFKAVLIPHRQGETLPITTWNANHTEVTVGADRIAFTPAATGKNDLVITREGKPLISMTKPIPAFRDAAIEQREAKIQEARRTLASFKPDSIPGRITVDLPGGCERVPGKVGQALSFAGAKESVPLAADLTPLAGGFTVALWFQAAKSGSGTILSSAGPRGLSIGVEGGKSLRIDALGQTRWQSVPLNLSDWHHIAVTGDGKRLTLRVDGKEVHSGDIAAPMQFAPSSQLGSGFTGLVDDLRIYGRALSGEELGKLYDFQAFVAPSLK